MMLLCALSLAACAMQPAPVPAPISAQHSVVHPGRMGATSSAATGSLIVNFQNGQVLTGSQLNQMQQGKADANGGTLASPTIIGGTASGTDTSATTALASGATTARAASSRFADTYNVLDFGALCDATTDSTSDDTAAFNRALAAAGSATSVGAGHKTVVIPGAECRISGEVDLPMGVSLRGAGFQSTLLDFSASSTIVYKAVNEQSASTVSDLGIQYTAGDPGASAKFALDMASNTPSMAIARNLYFINAHYAVDLSGNNDYLDSLHIIGNHGVGNFTTQAGTVDPRVTNTTIVGDYQPGGTTSSAIGMLVYDAGGLYLQNNDILYGKYGTEIIPGLNQQITWLFGDNTVLGDTTQNDMLHIDTTDATAKILGVHFVNSWTSNGGGTANWVANSAGGTVQGFTFDAHRALSGVNDEFHFASGVNKVTISATTACGDGSGSVVYIGSGNSDYTITGNNFSWQCTSSSSNTETGIAVIGSNNNIIATGNDLSLSAYPISVGTQASTANITLSPNIPQNNQAYAITAAATIDLPNAQDIYSVSGTTTITNMTSAWAGRRMIIYNSSGTLTFATGGTSGSAICNALSVAANVPVYAEFNGCWRLK